MTSKPTPLTEAPRRRPQSNLEIASTSKLTTRGRTQPARGRKGRETRDYGRPADTTMLRRHDLLQAELVAWQAMLKDCPSIVDLPLLFSGRVSAAFCVAASLAEDKFEFARKTVTAS
jgi:hypothetical protein